MDNKTTEFILLMQSRNFNTIELLRDELKRIRALTFGNNDLKEIQGICDRGLEITPHEDGKRI